MRKWKRDTRNFTFKYLNNVSTYDAPCYVSGEGLFIRKSHKRYELVHSNSGLTLAITAIKLAHAKSMANQILDEFGSLDFDSSDSDKIAALSQFIASKLKRYPY